MGLNLCELEREMAESKTIKASNNHVETGPAEAGLVENRRGFLKMAGLGAVTGAGALAVTGDKAEAAVVLNDTAKGYQETAHVKQFYDLAKF
jgi:hypothetical protein